MSCIRTFHYILIQHVVSLVAHAYVTWIYITERKSKVYWATIYGPMKNVGPVGPLSKFGCSVPASRSRSRTQVACGCWGKNRKRWRIRVLRNARKRTLVTWRGSAKSSSPATYCLMDQTVSSFETDPAPRSCCSGRWAGQCPSRSLTEQLEERQVETKLI